MSPGGLTVRSGLPVLPQRKAEEQDGREDDLQDADIPVAGVPGGAAGEYKAHDVGACGGSHTPHAVEPAHVCAGVVESYIVVEGGVHAARTQAVGNGPQAQKDEGVAEGEAEQGGRCHGHTDSCHLSGPQAQGQPVALEAGDDGACRDDHGNDAGVGHRHLEFLVHGGPGGPKESVGKAQAYKSKIYNR